MIRELKSAIAAIDRFQGSEFAVAKAKQNAIDARLTAASKAMEVFPKGAMGLTPDAVKATPEWKKAKAELDRAFKELQRFNAHFVKKFAKELREERQLRRRG